MNGKGDTPRPFSVDRETFESNWDRIFSKPKTPEMWKHSCTVEMGVMWIGKNEVCNFCGAWEEDGDDIPASPNWK